MWQFWVDRGGTFTDIVAKTPTGDLKTHKLLSENPEVYKDAAVHGIRALLDLDATAPVPRGLIEAVKLGTTVATNALLERKGERTVLFITKGLKDLLRIGYQNRPKLFDLNIQLPELLYEDVVEVDERLDADGNILAPLDVASAREALTQAHGNGYRSVAIALMHSYRFSDHEKQLGKIAQDVGFSQISLSHEVSPLIKLVGRGDTAVVDVYLSPILGRYVNQVADALGAHSAVISGNTEVSQSIADTLYGALGVIAGSQGTMNNFVYGNDLYQNCKTICGGTGAGDGFHGMSAVHSHMTNTRMTDPKVMETRFPVRVDAFSIRRGSGGRGRFVGGHGIVRRLTFNEAVTVTTLSSHTVVPPQGAHEGEPGALGENFVQRENGDIEILGGKDQVELAPGDSFIMKTPGSGGFGRPNL